MHMKIIHNKICWAQETVWGSVYRWFHSFFFFFFFMIGSLVLHGYSSFLACSFDFSSNKKQIILCMRGGELKSSLKFTIHLWCEHPPYSSMEDEVVIKSHITTFPFQVAVWLPTLFLETLYRGFMEYYYQYFSYPSTCIISSPYSLENCTLFQDV